MYKAWLNAFNILTSKEPVEHLLAIRLHVRAKGDNDEQKQGPAHKKFPIAQRTHKENRLALFVSNSCESIKLASVNKILN